MDILTSQEVFKYTVYDKFFQNIFLVMLLISLSIDIWHESNSIIIQ